MSIVQFLRIFWARRAIVLIAMIACFLGAYVVTLIVQPRYEATARVMLNFVRPDPITGELRGARTASAFIDSQVELIKSYEVTGRVVDRFGWLSEPNRMRAYAKRPATDTREYRRWLTQEIVDNTETRMSGSALEITYKSNSPVAAQAGAEALRDAFLEESVSSKRKAAAEDARWFEQQASAARQLAETAEMAKAAYERESGIIMQGRESDLDTERLAALAGQAAVGPVAGVGMVGSSAAALQLAQIDAQMAEASQRLGPNHPEMQALRSRRAVTAQLAAQEQSQARAASSGASAASALGRALQAQKARVIGQREKVERLRQLQAEADLRRDQYKSAAARAAQFSLEASVTESDMKKLGVVLAPKSPTFPNKPLILGGSLALGVAMGLALSLLLELLNRRVRGVEDLMLSSEIHCVSVVEQPKRRRPSAKTAKAPKTRGARPRHAGATA